MPTAPVEPVVATPSGSDGPPSSSVAPSTLVIPSSTRHKSSKRFTPASRTGASHGSATSLRHNSSLSLLSSSPSPRIVFGSGTLARLPTELGRLRLSSPLIVSSPSRTSVAHRVLTLAPNFDISILDSAVGNMSQRAVQEAMARNSKRDCVISIGGTSAVKLAGAIASGYNIPHVCIPTSYSGSEAPLVSSVPHRRGSKNLRRKGSPVTSSGASSSGSSKRSGKRSTANAGADCNQMPAVVIYDEELTSTGTPMVLSAPTGYKSEDMSGRDLKDGDSQWSFIQLPGV
ncbi:Iron-containing alcohol dehydrogenase [Geosmithia morbida]|uniref:Iron-containing alcohol dehydrogenase n=1 Tax=Geosmithia morbida TaxID=1094350 RepID=A0A9P5D3D1_9HYPO|nr:Iron-containing alcohol dehydrogenase [Geosmithia morbida]KAF4120394.1 Iron-containing alcohol dehydrogenase [Geosmithia morbida]